MATNRFFYKTQCFLLSLYVFTSVLFPVFILNKIIFMFIIMFFFLDLKNIKLKFLYQPFVIFIIFLIGYNVSIYTFSSHELAIQLLLSSLIGFLIYPIYIYKIDIDKIIKQSGVIFSLTTLLFAYFLVIDQTTFVSNIFLTIFDNYTAGANSFRSFIPDENLFMFHFGAVPFLFLSIAIYSRDFFLNWKINELFNISLMLFIVIISTSRALFFTSILIIVISSICYLNTKKRLIVIVISSLLLLMFIINFYSEISYIFDLNETSNSVKKGHIVSFINNLNCTNFMFGEGLGSYYFSSGKAAITAQTELTILDFIRYFGIIGTAIIYLIILNPNLNFTSKLKKDDIYYILVIVLYTFISFTNPTMFNSYGLIVVLWYWNNIITRRRLK